MNSLIAVLEHDGWDTPSDGLQSGLCVEGPPWYSSPGLHARHKYSMDMQINCKLPESSCTASKVLQWTYLQTFAPGYPPPRTEAHRGAARGAFSFKQNMSPIQFNFIKRHTHQFKCNSTTHYCKYINSLVYDVQMFFGFRDIISFSGGGPGRAGAGGNQLEDSDHGRLAEIRSRTWEVSRSTKYQHGFNHRRGPLMYTSADLEPQSWLPASQPACGRPSQTCWCGGASVDGPLKTVHTLTRSHQITELGFQQVKNN